MANRNITLQRKTATGYDKLYPKTKVSQIEDFDSFILNFEGVETLEAGSLIPVDIEGGGDLGHIRFDDFRAQLGGVGIVVSNTEPAGQAEGDFWFEETE